MWVADIREVTLLAQGSYKSDLAREVVDTASGKVQSLSTLPPLGKCRVAKR